MQTIAPQFADPVHDAQVTFRAILKAVSRPGLASPLPLPGGAPSAMPLSMASVALAMLDDTTPVWLDEKLATVEVEQYLRFHCGAARTLHREAASFAFVADPSGLDDLTGFPIGVGEYPDRSSTMVFALPSLAGGKSVVLTGPGIETKATISPVGLPDWFWSAWANNTERYPLGIDAILVDRNSILGLPRTTKAALA